MHLPTPEARSNTIAEGGMRFAFPPYSLQPFYLTQRCKDAKRIFIGIGGVGKMSS
jgi:hypothetical protein